MSRGEEDSRLSNLASDALPLPGSNMSKVCTVSPTMCEQSFEEGHHNGNYNRNLTSPPPPPHPMCGVTDLNSHNSSFSGQNGVESDGDLNEVNSDRTLLPNGEEQIVNNKSGESRTTPTDIKDTDLILGVAKEPVQIILSADQLSSLSKEDLIEKWTQQDIYIAFLQSKLETTLHEEIDVKGSSTNEDRVKPPTSEAQRKEQYYIMRLATKEQDIQDLGAQVEELKNQVSGTSTLKHSLLDPAVNLLFERMKRDFDSVKLKMEETQNELAAWKFTPDSNTGKQLMAKCRLLIKENEELGKMISSGKLSKLEGDLALQRNFTDEFKKSQSELDEFLQEMDEDTEGMQGTILYLQSQLRQAKERIAHLSNQGTANNTPTGDYNVGGGFNDDSMNDDSLGIAGDTNDSRELDEENSFDQQHYIRNLNGDVDSGDQYDQCDNVVRNESLSFSNKRIKGEMDEGMTIDDDVYEPLSKRTKTSSLDNDM